MLNKQYFLRLGFVSLLLLGSAYAWYPNYTVMVTDFPIREDYLQPVRLSSIELTGLGSNFQSLFHHPLDDAFMNPAYLSQNSRHYLYIDAARDEFEPRYEPGGIRPAYIMEMGTQADVIMPYPFYWSPYREPVPDSASEPLLRLVYLGPLFGKSSPLHFGVSAEYYYNQTEFYRPTWYWYGLRYTDAFGAAMGEDLQDPYEDVRLAETGENVETNQGFRVNGMLSWSLFQRLHLGIGYSIHMETTDGTYQDWDIRNDNNYADDYRSYRNNQRDRIQDFVQQEVRAGLLLSAKKGTKLGVTAGVIPGTLERTYTVNDSSHYYSLYHYSSGDSSRYLNERGMQNEKEWAYDGHTLWGSVHGDIPLGTSRDMVLRFELRGSRTNADLDETESLYQQSTYEQKYWIDDDQHYRHSESLSWATLERTGSGELTRENIRGTIGVDWKMSPTVRFIGGLTVNSRQQSQWANEPFEGEKYADYYYENYNYPEYSSRKIEESDDKTYAWHQDRTNLILALPFGVFIQVAEVFEIQLGLTKVMNQMDIEEGYHLNVHNEEKPPPLMVWSLSIPILCIQKAIRSPVFTHSPTNSN